MRIRIENDLFGIADRLKNIDSDYAVFYDKKKCKFELHNMRLRPTLQVVLPYPRLDKRALDYALKTQVKVVLNEILNIDAHNQMIADKCETSKIDEVTRKLISAIKYVERGGDELPDYSRL